MHLLQIVGPFTTGEHTTLADARSFAAGEPKVEALAEAPDIRQSSMLGSLLGSGVTGAGCVFSSDASSRRRCFGAVFVGSVGAERSPRFLWLAIAVSSSTHSTGDGKACSSLYAEAFMSSGNSSAVGS